MFWLRYFAVAAGAALCLGLLPTTTAQAQFCESSSPGWHNAAAGMPGCVPLLPVPGGGAPTGVLAANDDGSTSAIDLSAAFPGGLNFFGGPFTSVVINNNGNVTFGGGLFTYTPRAFPLTASGGTSYPMIAPYWGDVDTRGGTAAPTANYVWWYLERGRFIVTWHDVGYFLQHHEKQMDFQMIITNAVGCASGDFDVEFRYNKCEWTTGDASGGSGGFGGTPAQVGFDANNGVDFVSVPGSLTMAILDQCVTSNVGMPGVWRFSVHGGMVACPGTGDACDTGMPGACGIGVTQCIGGGVECVGVGTPSDERCDGVDNDCNGAIDDGEGLCTSPNVCYQGSCVPPCFEGGCGEGETCSDDGTCVDTACIGMTCPAGERCTRGMCVGACEGIVCPHGRQCVAGRCVDICAVITCGEGEVCQDGACRPECPCYECDADEICNADGTCTPIGCDIVVCDPGFYCEDGSCLDACDGAICPTGQYCDTGECVEGMPPGPDAGVPTDDGGVGPMADSGMPGVDGGMSGIDGGGGGGDAGGGRGGGKGGCGCHVPGRAEASGWAWALVLGAWLFWRRRRGR